MIVCSFNFPCNSFAADVTVKVAALKCIQRVVSLSSKDVRKNLTSFNIIIQHGVLPVCVMSVHD